ncbi:TetR/AcrR family transcriptional regulator [Lactobacillus sp. ESL0791]|uniref:TetR/AcrR family transcriptional regulator n=1 Tax=Lactobacillus sp. ESL0791 TaxID=2983234 RepID=UPI0023F868EF|nr:TetR/AcrR family transcriptional regulator [Lactobacillus sp. ESL0791]MDF7639748.1 TetR/AcrR family transcriptional regulator [Lactobacillus sp. ESL0791]
MVKQTFINLPEKKRQRVTAALLKEFSQYPLKDAEVAHIVRDAGIARGAFYKYFIDLIDAYRYLYRIALSKIHTDVKITDTFQPEIFYEQVVNFLDQTEHSEYAPLIRMHILYNESVLPHAYKNLAKLHHLSAEIWTAMVLSHDVIRLVFTDPKNKDNDLARFKESLMILKRGSVNVFSNKRNQA